MPQSHRPSGKKSDLPRPDDWPLAYAEVDAGPMGNGGTGPVARLFDELTPFYDQSGVAFFGPIAERLVGLLAPEPGANAVDLGCGRGAVTIRLARRVGPRGRVTAVDLSPSMAAATRQEAVRQGLSWVEARSGDAAEPGLPADSASIVTASLVLFFLPDPLAAVRRWLSLLSPGGLIGITTFGAQDDVWQQVDDLFDPYLSPEMLDPRTSGRRGPFGSEAALATLVEEAGGVVVSSTEESLPVAFADVEQWERFSLSTGQRQMWDCVPETERSGLRRAAGRLLESARTQPDGPIEVSQMIRYTLVRRAGGRGVTGPA